MVGAGEIPAGWRVMDVGPRAADAFARAVDGCRTVLWNGPMGVFEWKSFSGGTVRLANALSGLSGATTVVGGGSTAEAVQSLGYADKMTHVSTGGGASLSSWRVGSYRAWPPCRTKCSLHESLPSRRAYRVGVW